MNNNHTTIALVALYLFLGCTKQSGTTGNPPPPADGAHTYSMARFSGPNYSQAISVDSANTMINSYLNSIHYPTVDTAIRSLSFDADTLRAYLQNSNIVTLKFIIAHRPEYKNEHSGQYAGMNPDALTVIVVGQDEDDNYVLSGHSQVYEHMLPCPTNCTGNSDGYIH